MKRIKREQLLETNTIDWNFYNKFELKRNIDISSLFPHQKEGVILALLELARPQQIKVTYINKKTGETLTRNRIRKPVFLIADEPGLGKTLQAIKIMEYLASIRAKDRHYLCRRVLILCPASLVWNWHKEILDWLPEEIRGKMDIDVRSYQKAPEKEEMRKREKTMNFRGAYDFVIVDEAHYIKNPKAKRTKNFLHEIAPKAFRILFLTATPTPNYLIEFFPMLSVINPDKFSNYMAFATKYCGGYQGKFGFVATGVNKKNLREIKETLKSKMIKRKKAQVLSDLPDKLYKEIWINEIDDDSIDFGIESNTKFDYGLLSLAETIEELAKIPHISTARAQLGVLKAFYASRYLKDLLESLIVKKVVVFAHHKEAINIIKESLKKAGIPFVSLSGESSSEERKEAVESFQNKKEIQVFVGSIKAAGEGLTLTAASDVVFCELDWTPASNLQAEDRLHRIGQKNSVVIHKLIARNSLDIRIMSLLSKKEKGIALVFRDNLDL